MAERRKPRDRDVEPGRPRETVKRRLRCWLWVGGEVGRGGLGDRTKVAKEEVGVVAEVAVTWKRGSERVAAKE